MRGLTDAERQELLFMADPAAPDIYLGDGDDPIRAILERLAEHGRAVLTVERHEDGDEGVWSITEQGRLALRLWPAIRRAA